MNYEISVRNASYGNYSLFCFEHNDGFNTWLEKFPKYIQNYYEKFIVK